VQKNDERTRLSLGRVEPDFLRAGSDRALRDEGRQLRLCVPARSTAPRNDDERGEKEEASHLE
jgi:hypothetical protein